MSVASGIGPAPESFCKQCAEHGFEECFFPSQLIDVPSDPVDGLLDWQSVITNNQQCVFCRLLIFSLLLQPRFKEIRFTGEFCGIYLRLVETGRATWDPPKDDDVQEQPSGHGWIRGENVFYRIVRHLKVHGRGGGTSVTTRTDPCVYDYMSEEQKLLLSRSTPTERLDLAQVEASLSVCKTCHTRSCNSGYWADMAGIGLWMIDMQNRCVTTPTTEVPCCALSYC